LALVFEHTNVDVIRMDSHPARHEPLDLGDRPSFHPKLVVCAQVDLSIKSHGARAKNVRPALDANFKDIGGGNEIGFRKLNVIAIGQLSGLETLADIFAIGGAACQKQKKHSASAAGDALAIRIARSPMFPA